jgi:hypothetical protein
MTFMVCRTVRKPRVNAGVGQTVVCQQEWDRLQLSACNLPHGQTEGL